MRPSRVVRFFSKKPVLYSVRYARGDGHYREIVVPTGRGRFRTSSRAQALEIATRRLREQYGDGVYEREQRERDLTGSQSLIVTEAELLRLNPDLHQDNYTLESVQRV